jgi:hypothetical protein
LSSGKTKKNAIFFKKTRFLWKNGAFSMVFRVLKRKKLNRIFSGDGRKKHRTSGDRREGLCFAAFPALKSAGFEANPGDLSVREWE